MFLCVSENECACVYMSAGAHLCGCGCVTVRLQRAAQIDILVIES